MSRPVEITMEDVESAVIVLREFLRRQREVQGMMRQLQGSEGTRGMFGMPSMEQIIQATLKAKDERARTQKTATEEGTESLVDLSEEDLKRMHEITEKRKGIKTAQTTKTT